MKASLLLTIGLLCGSTLSVYAENIRKEGSLKMAMPLTVTQLDSSGAEIKYKFPDEDLNYIMSEKLDSMVNTWYIQNMMGYDEQEITTIPEHLKETLPDSVYLKRLSDINSYISLSYNNTVKNFISLYTIKRREQMSVMLGLARYYFPLFEEVFDKYQMPLELKYMAVIESALNPKAFSRAGASGLWQFMYGTGKMYGLEVNSFIDDRRDPVKATAAAARHLKDLYNIFNDWHLVIAAYNCGAGNVNKAIRRSGGSRNYWDIYYKLPRETRGYVPAFIAATYAMHYAEEHMLYAKEPDFNTVTDSVVINYYLHLQQVSEVLGISIEEIRYLNPQYRRDVIPATKKKPYSLKLPVEHISLYIDTEKTIYAHNREKFFPDNKIVIPKSRSYYKYTPINIKGKEKVYYTVKPGDNLGYISSWFKVRAADLRYWNNIRRNLIKAGQKLLIYVPEGKGAYFKSLNEKTFAQKQAGISNSVPATKTNSSTGDASFIPGEYIYYTVRRGDSLWSIAKKYPGVSNYDIIKANNLSVNSKIYPGQKLKIPKRT